MSERERVEPNKGAIEAAMNVDADSRSRSLTPEDWWLKVLQAAYAIDFAQLQAERDQLRLALQEAQAEKKRFEYLWELETRRAVKAEGECFQDRFALQESQQKNEWYAKRCKWYGNELEKSQQRVKELEANAIAEDSDNDDLLTASYSKKMELEHICDYQQTVIKELAEALRALYDNALADAYITEGQRQQVNAALASASPWLRKEGE